MSAPRSVAVLTSDLSACKKAQAGSLVWVKASHQPSTKPHAQNGNGLCEAGVREVSWP